MARILLIASFGCAALLQGRTIAAESENTGTNRDLLSSRGRGRLIPKRFSRHAPGEQRHGKPGPGRPHGNKMSLDAHVSHGVNIYNNEKIVDWTADSNIFGAFPPIPEVGVLNTEPGATNGSVITKETPLDSPMVNIDAVIFNTLFQSPPGPGPFNVPIHEVGTLTVASTDINDRTPVVPFEESADVANIPAYLSANADPKVTLAEWNKLSGRVSGICYKDGTSEVTVEIKNALPNAAYTMWDIGVTKPLTPNEAVSAGPFGGLPNILLADDSGRGSQTRKLQHCPWDGCEGTERCTLYLSVFYHWDHMVYGGAPALGGGPTVVQVAGNQLQFLFQGKRLIDVQNPF